MNFKIIESTKRGKPDFIVIRIGGSYEQHGHFKTREGAEKIINLIKSNKLPKNKYFRDAAKRLLTEREFENLKEPKPRYYNVGRKHA